jgi:glycosyltransferase involved in cell wall biosynthesis
MQVADAGRVVPPTDIRRAVEAVISLSRDPEERLRLGGAAIARACERFSDADFSIAVRNVAAELSLRQGREIGTTMR